VRAPFKAVDIFVVILLALVLGLVYVAAEMSALARPAQDMAAYWTAAHLIRQNPYSLPLVRAMELAMHARIPAGSALIMRNPPWALPFVLPLRWMSFPAAYAFWTILSAAIIGGCGRQLWRLYSPRPSLKPAFICFLFGPTLLLLNLGQTTPFVLLGVTLFWYAVQRRRDWLAGAALLLVVIKPQIVLLFLLVLALWIVRTKRWTILGAGALSVCASCLLAVWLNPNVFRQYLQLVHELRYENAYYPNIGGLMYMATGHHWLAFLPQIVGVPWLLAYWAKYRDRWEWTTNGAVVLLVSIACSYYGFGYDEILALPALLWAAAAGSQSVFWTGFVLTNPLQVSCWYEGGFVRFNPILLYFAGTAWLLLYLLSMRKTLVKERVRAVTDRPLEHHVSDVPEVTNA
jgi:hypothetical protein